jgi:hypothetical protein
MIGMHVKDVKLCDYFTYFYTKYPANHIVKYKVQTEKSGVLIRAWCGKHASGSNCHSRPLGRKICSNCLRILNYQLSEIVGAVDCIEVLPNE